MDCSDNQASEILEWTSKFSNHNFALSIETSGVDTNDSIALANYYHAIRFVRYYQFRTIYEGPLWLVDADAIINKDIFKALQSPLYAANDNELLECVVKLELIAKIDPPASDKPLKQKLSLEMLQDKFSGKINTCLLYTSDAADE